MLDIRLVLPEGRPWASAGHVVAREQFTLQDYSYPSAREVDFTQAEKSDTKTLLSEDPIIFKGERYDIEIDSQTGAITKYRIDNIPRLVRPLEPYFWKPANRNQAHDKNGYERRLGAWRSAAEDRELLRADWNSNSAKFEFRLPVIGARYFLTYVVDAKGVLTVTADYRPTDEADHELIPKFGLRLGVPIEFDLIRWYGRGPHENYWDRNWSAHLGNYEMPLHDYWTNYIRPQDNGNRAGVRWWECCTASGVGLRIEGLQELSIRAWPFDEADIEAARLPQQLPRRDFTNVNIDWRVHGVGGDNSWGQRTMDKYTLRADKPHYFGFILSAAEGE